MKKLNLRYMATAGVVCVTIALLITSCLPADKHFHSYRSMPSCGWVWGDTVLFITPLSDSSAHYRYTVEVRHDNSYPYRQLALAFSVTPLEEPAVYTDTLSCPLSNTHGVWIGQGWGNLFVSNHPGRTFTIPHSGSYMLRLSHIMQCDTLPGIYDIGVKIESVTNNQE